MACIVLRFFGRYPPMCIDPLLPECHGTSSGSWMERMDNLWSAARKESV